VRIRDLSGELLSMVEIESMKARIREALTEVFVTDEAELVMCSEIIADREEDIYAEKVIEVLERVGEPIVRVDFLDAMDFLTVKGRTFFRPARKLIDEAVETLPRLVRRIARFELAVPVMRDERCVAVLLLGPRHGNRHYSAQEQALLSMLSSQIAASLSRIDLLEEVVEKKVIEEELNIARTIQVNLLPSAPPSLEEYEAAALSISSKYVGGDYYDFIERNGLLAFTVADVSGKGVPASLLMASLQASFRSLMDRMDNPLAVVGRLNNVMCDITAPDKFATLFYGCLDTRRHELQYTNAGHFFPVIVRGGGEVEVLDYSGLILGVQPEFPYQHHKLKMHAGDTLVVTTDGVTEAENMQGELYGEERLYPLLSSLHGRSADEVKEVIVDKVNTFSHPKGANDDLTILVLRRKV
jgi:sigma-B regulation protein RsbU (phosphoserine phosphatase)